MDLAIIVPGRMASTRFPNKLAHPIKGIPLIVRTAQRIKTEVPEIPLYFAVDHPELKSLLEDAGFDAIMTRVDHASGTDRIAEANASIQAKRVINVQADEPLVTQSQIHQLKELIYREGIDLATVAHPFHKVEDFLNPNQVKVVISNSGEALYFSRSPIPYDRDSVGNVTEDWLTNHPCYRHLGLYAYTKTFLEAFTQLSPGNYEQIEKLEQLRALENGFRIAVGITNEISLGVDTVEDAIQLESLI